MILFIILYNQVLSYKNMEPVWKIDLSNSGSCFSLGKELATTRPSLEAFLSANLRSDPDELSFEMLYNCFLNIFSSIYTQISSLEASQVTKDNLILNYQKSLKQQQEKILKLEKSSNREGPRPVIKNSIPSGPISSDDSLKIPVEDLNDWGLKTTKIQASWRGYKERKNYKNKIQQIMKRNKPKTKAITNQDIMKDLSNLLDKKGLNFEQCFRAADVDYDGKITFEELLKFFNDLKVELPKSYINRFMLIVDEDCSGVIEKKEFNAALTAYHVSSEDHWKSIRSYQEEVLLKFVKILDSRGIEPEEIFNLCDTDSSGTISLKELEKYLLGLKVGFKEKEVYSLMARLDADKSGELNLEEFKSHLAQGQILFDQEVVASTSTMVPLNQVAEVLGLRDLVKVLEASKSVLSILDSIKNYPNGEITVSKFYEEVNKCFSCKLTKDQSGIINKALVLTSSGMVNSEKIKPVLLFYSSRALGTKENYLIRIKMHTNTPESKTFNKNDMVRYWVFTQEQCNEAIQLLAKPGNNYIDRESIYPTNKPEIIINSDNNSIILYFTDKLEEIKLEITNIFRFADKKNEQTIKVSDFCLAMKKIIPNVQPDMLKGLERLFPQEKITMETVLSVFPTKKLDQNGLTLEKAYWAQRLSTLLIRSKIQPNVFYSTIKPENNGQVTYKNLKDRINQDYVLVFKKEESEYLIKSFTDNENNGISQLEFLDLLKKAQETNHNNSSLIEYGRKAKSEIAAELDKPKPSQLKPRPDPRDQNKRIVIPVKPQISIDSIEPSDIRRGSIESLNIKTSSISVQNIKKENIPAQNIKNTNYITDNESIIKLFNTLSSKLPDLSLWAADIFKKKSIDPRTVLNKNTFFKVIESFDLARNQSDDIFEFLDYKSQGCIYSYTFFTVLDAFTHVLPRLPFVWNSNFSPKISAFIQNISAQNFQEKLNTELCKVLPIDFLGGNKPETKMTRDCFDKESPWYHWVSVVKSYTSVYYISGIDVIRSYIFFNEIDFRRDLDKVFDDERSFKEYLCNGLKFIDFEAESIIKDVYGNYENIYPMYQLITLADTTGNNKRSSDIEPLPFKYSKPPPEVYNFFLNLSEKFNKPLFYYNLKINDELSWKEIDSVLKSFLGEEDYGQISKLAPKNENIKIYVFLSVLDSYRKFPMNLYYDYSHLENSFNIPKTVFQTVVKDRVYSKKDVSEFGCNKPDEILFFLNPMKENRNLVYGFQLVYLYDHLEIWKKLNDKSPLILNYKSDKEIRMIIQNYADFLDKNDMRLEKVLKFGPDQSFTKESLKQLPNAKDINLLNKAYEAIYPNVKSCPFYYFLSVIESYRKKALVNNEFNSQEAEYIKNWSIKLLSKLPSNKSISDIFKNIDLNDMMDSNEFYNRIKEFKVDGRTIQIDSNTIETIFGTIKRRNTSQILGYEFFTFVDVLKINQIKLEQNQGDFLKLPYNNEPGVSRETLEKYEIVANTLDSKKKLTLDTNLLQNIDPTSFIELPSFAEYLNRLEITKNIEFLYASVKFNEKVILYHFCAVLESYRKKMFFPNKNSPSRPSQRKKTIIRNLSEIYLPIDTKGIPNDSYDMSMYMIKKYMKSNYGSVEKIFNDADQKKTGILNETELFNILKIMYPKISLEHTKKMIREADLNQDKKIDYEEFITYVFQYLISSSTANVEEEEEKKGKSDNRIKNNLVPSQGSLKVEEESKGIFVPNKGPLKIEEEKKLDTKLPSVTPIQDNFRLTAEDFFTKQNPKCTTILNSQEAAIQRCKELLENRREEFKDPEFGPEQGKNGDICLYWNGKPPTSSYPNPSELVWTSPKEYIDDTEFFVGGTSSSDVLQGSLGDCWFVGALSVMALRDDLLYGNVSKLENPDQITPENCKYVCKGVYPPIFHSLAKKNMYVLRFFINSAWRWVIIDGRLPMFHQEGYEPEFVFGHCKEKRELWVPLIEKAYAKVFGCYEALNGGLIDDALTDLTGLVAEKSKILGKGGVIDGPPETLPKKIEDFWGKLMGFRKDGVLLGCSIDGGTVEGEVIIDGERTGLIGRHAYAIIDIIYVTDNDAPKKRHRLIRLRNPWGQREWQGKWKDGSPELEKHFESINQELKKLGDDENYNEYDTNDGTFLMCYKDWRSIYNNFYACVDFSDSWFGIRFAGGWTTETAGGVPTTGSMQECERWATNPQYKLTLKTKTEVLISLAQEDGRYIKNAQFPFVEVINTACFTIMKAGPDEKQATKFTQNKIVKLSVLKQHRCLDLRINLDPGSYFVVPAIMEPGKTGKFWLSIYLDCDKKDVTTCDCRNPADQGSYIVEEEEDVGPATIEAVKSAQDLFGYLSSL